MEQDKRELSPEELALQGYATTTDAILYGFNRSQLQELLIEAQTGILETPRGVPMYFFTAKLVLRCYEVGVIGPLCTPWVVGVVMPDGAPVFISSMQYGR